MSEDMAKSIENICPKGMKLSIIKYETDDDITLNIYSKDYLDATHENRSSSIVMMMSPDKKFGPNGMRNRMCQIKAVEDYDLKELELEVFSFTMMSPEMTFET